MVIVRQVNGSKKGMKDFIDFPYALYRKDGNWCPPLRFERRKFFSSENPFVQENRIAFFLAYEDNRPVGRVTAHIDERHNRHYRTRHAFFGFYESIDNLSVAEKLMQSAENWAKTNHMASLSGPYNFNTKQELGFLIEGSEEPNFLMMTYTKGYYVDLLNRIGYRKEKGLVSYRIDNTLEMPDLVARTAKRLLDKYGPTVQIQILDRRNLRAEHPFILEVYNDAWSDNWGFIPMTERELAHIIREVKFFADPGFIYKLYKDGDPAAFMLNLPNINDVLIRIHDGRLLPTGFLKILRYRNYIRSAVITIMGVKKKYRKLGFELLLYYRLFQDHRKDPLVQAIETTWILEDNVPMIKSLEYLNARPTKRYVILRKDLLTTGTG